MNKPIAQGPGAAPPQAGVPLQRFLVMLIWLCVAPLLALATWFAADHIGALRDHDDAEAANLARNFATTINQHLRARIDALNMLALSTEIDDPARWDELYREAQGFQRSFGSHVVFADASGQMLFNTRVPMGTPLPLLPRPKGHAAVPTALATGRPAVGDTFIGPIAGVPLVASAVPVMRDGRARFLMLAIFETRLFQQHIDLLSLPANWSLTLFDGKGDIVARRAPPPTGGSVQTTHSFVAQVELAPWSVRLDIPSSAYREPLIDTAYALLATILLATLAGVVGGSLTARHLSRSVESLVEPRIPGAAAPAIREVVLVRHRLDQAEAATQRANHAWRVLSEGNQIMVRAGDEMGLLRDICRLLVEIGGYRMAWVGYAEDNQERNVRPVASAGDEGDYLSSARITWADTEWGRGPTGTAIREHRPVIARDTQADPSYEPWREAARLHGFASSIALPLLVDETHCLGALGIYSAEVGIFDAEEVRLLVELAHDIAYGIGALRERVARARTEASLRENEARLRNLFDQANDGIYIISADNRYLDANTSGLALLGYTRDELLAMGVADVLASHEVARLAVEPARMMGGEPHLAEWEHVRKDGSRFPGEVSARRLDAHSYLAIVRDLTSRRLAEEAQRESARLLRALMDRTFQSIGMLTPQGILTDANSTALAMIGANKTDVLGRPFWDTPWWSHSKQEQDRLRDAIARAARGEFVRFETVLPAQGGGLRHIDFSIKPVFDDDGKVIFLIPEGRDISGRKQAEVALANEALRRRILMESSRDGIAIIGRRHQVVEANPRFAEMLGYTPAEVLELHTWDWEATMSEAEIRENFQDLLQAHTTIETRHRRKDGTVYDAEVSIGGAMVGDEPMVFTISRDVTERKRSEAALRENAARYRTLLDSLPQLIWQKNRDSVYVGCNTAYARGLGVAAEEVPGKTDYDFYAADLADKYRADDLRILAGGVIESLEERWVSAGEERYIHTTKVPLRDEQGLAYATLGIAEDITERKRDEIRLHIQAGRAHALLELPSAAERLDETAFMQYGQELAERLTGSEIAFIHFVNDDEETIELVAWSRRTLESYCTAAYDKHYPVSQAGIWADALRNRAPVMVNDYPNAPGRCGLPEGHAALTRFVCVPVVESGKVVMLAGVGDKAEPYTDLDVESVQLIADSIWRIVQRRRTVEALRTGEARYRALVDNMSDGVAVYQAVDDGRDFVFREYNKASERIGKLARDQVIGRRITEVFPGVVAMGLLGAMQRVNLAGVPERLSDGYYQDQRIEHYVDNYIYRLSTGEVVAVYADITERKAAEVQVRKLSLAVEQSPESIVITGLDANIEYVNEAFLRNTGYHRDEVVGRNPRILHSGKTPLATYKAMWQALSSGEVIPPFSIASRSRGHWVMANFCFGVIPPKAMFGRS